MKPHLSRLIVVPVLLCLFILSFTFIAAQDTTPAPLPDGPLALITLGDSLTEGAEDSLELGGYPGRLMTLLQDEHPDSTLTNLGHSGWSSDALIVGDQGLPSELDEALKAIDQAKAAKQHPVALVWIGSNDLFYLYAYNNPSTEDEAADFKRYASNLDTILGKLKDAGATLAIALLDDQSQRPVTLNGQAFPDISEYEIVEMSRQVQGYNQIIAEKAALYGALTVDFYNTTIFTDPATLADDGNHPNPAGYDVIAQLWYDALLHPTAIPEIVPATATPTTVPDGAVSATPTHVPYNDQIPQGAIALITLGDSLTEGEGDSDGLGGYPGRLFKFIDDIRPGTTLTNLGHSGWSTDAVLNGDQGMPSEMEQALEAIDLALAVGQPPVVLVWAGSNDLWYLYEYGDPDAAAEAADVEHFAANIDTILNQLDATGAHVVVALLDDQSERPVAIAGQAFTGISKDELARMSDQVARYNDVIAEKAAKYHMPTVDFSRASLFTDPTTLADDGNHPNPAGYEIVARYWFDVLAPYMNIDE